MSKRYRGRYITTRLYKRSLNSSDPPKGSFYSIRQLTVGASPAKDLATVTGSKIRPFRSRKRTPRSSFPRVYFSALAISSICLSSPSSLLLKHLPPEPRGVANKFILGDSSPAGQTTQPQSRAFLRGYHWKRPTFNCPALSVAFVWSNSNVPHSSLMNPYGFA
ncbi:hypothetical protein AVEN_24229-1 [Araneus ventricosus]|uniref:Uncharacterized protein n=1 Tax=Araneus ventricosus TaxID=182803 RepID=A0A4Y2PCC7_ARAVE|nr:hypothetical protein AVEN_157335-1 [Araneus ventricosus]GBN48134.1 hypothetical protein AVEN_24229-1 [Araneus ventricosus]